MRPYPSLLILTLTCLLGSLPAYAQNSFFFPQIGDGVVQNIRFQTTVVLVNTGSEVTVELEFFRTGSGEPLEVSLGNLGTASNFSITLPDGGSVSLQTSGNGEIAAGYARVTDPRNSAEPVLGGTAVFTRTDVQSGVILFEAGVPATSSLNTFTVFVDTLEGLETGLALVNVENFLSAEGQSETPEIHLTLRGPDAEEVAETVVPLAAGSHVAKFIGEFFEDVVVAGEIQGTVVVDSPDARLAAVTLRQNDQPDIGFPDEVPTLTTFPVIPGAAGDTATGLLTALDANRLSLTFKLPDLDWITEARFSFVRDNQEVTSLTRPVTGGQTFSDVFVMPGLSRTIDRVVIEAQGRAGQRSLFTLQR